MLNKYLLNKLKKKSRAYSRRPTSNQGDRTDPLGRTGGSSGGGVWVAALLTCSDPTLSTDRLGILHPPICGLEPIEGMLLRAGGQGSSRAFAPNENRPSPHEAPLPLSEPQRRGINARRERQRGLLFVRLSRACLRRRLRAPIDQACGKIPPPGLPLWPRCQAAGGVTAQRRGALPLRWARACKTGSLQAGRVPEDDGRQF